MTNQDKALKQSEIRSLKDEIANIVGALTAAENVLLDLRKEDIEFLAEEKDLDTLHTANILSAIADELDTLLSFRSFRV